MAHCAYPFLLVFRVYTCRYDLHKLAVGVRGGILDDYLHCINLPIIWKGRWFGRRAILGVFWNTVVGERTTMLGETAEASMDLASGACILIDMG